MKFSQLCVAGALSLEVLSRGVNFASALKHDASKESTSTHMMRKDTQVLKNEEMKEGFKALHGHRALEEDVDLNWEESAIDTWAEDDYCYYSELSMSDDGNTFATGCKEANSETGMVKVYSLVDGQWAQKGPDIVGEKANELLGRSVALSNNGSILAIGITHRSFGADKSDAGCIEVYEYNGTSWTLMGDLIKGLNNDEGFGEKVSLSADGNIVAGSGNLLDNGRKGFVRVYQFVDTKWEQLGSLISGQNNNDALGHSLSLSDNGKVMAIGIPGTDVGENHDNTGSFDVYEYDDVDNGWVLIGDTIHGEVKNSQLGYSIQISRDATTVIVGAGPNEAYVMVYRLNNENQWEKIGDNDNLSELRVVYTVSISKDGNTILVSNQMNEYNYLGVVRVYKYSDNKWDQLGKDIHGDYDYGYSGHSVDLSADGNTFVAAINKGASVYTLPLTEEEWDGVWYINYDSVVLSGNVLTSTYLTKPDIDSDYNVSHTLHYKGVSPFLIFFCTILALFPHRY